MTVSKIISHLRAIIALALVFIINTFPAGIFLAILFSVSNPHTWGWVQDLVAFTGKPINENNAISVLMMLMVFTPVVLALFPFTPRIIAFFSGWKKAKGENKEYIKSCLEPVCQKAGRNIESLNLYIAETNEVNAAAFGLNNILVYDGAIQADKQKPGFLCGILAHELGHISYMHGANLIFLYMITLGANLSLKLVNFCVWVSQPLGYVPIINFMYAIIMFCLGLYMRLFALIDTITNYIVLWFARMDEHAADKYACEIGYGQDLLYSLTDLQQMTWIPEKKGFFANIGEDHPSLPHRIETIQKYLEKHPEKTHAYPPYHN